MLSDEFERIVVAVMAMQNVNLGANLYIPLDNVLKVLHSNLHHEDKDCWRLGVGPNGFPMVQKVAP